MYCRPLSQLIVSTSPYQINFHIITSINKQFLSLNHSILSCQINQGILFFAQIQSACIVFNLSILPQSTYFSSHPNHSPFSIENPSNFHIQNPSNFPYGNSQKFVVTNLINKATTAVTPTQLRDNTRTPLLCINQQHRRVYTCMSNIFLTNNSHE